MESSVRRKKRGGLDVFQFAETVEPEAWSDRSKVLQDHISALEREQALKAGTQPVRDDDARLPQQVRRPDLSKQYTVVLEDESPSPNPTLPSSALVAKDVEEKGHLDYKLYDAVLSSDAPSPVDPEMEKFLPLLQEYLTIHDVKPSASHKTGSTGSLTPSYSRSSAPVPIDAPAPIPPSDDPDYVWDVFYHRAGLLNDHDAVGNIATLTGLPGPLADAYASASESEEEDEADEDSNGTSFPTDARITLRYAAEEYYKNDYPDEESSDYGTSEGSGKLPARILFVFFFFGK
ncbi:hypothetical protein B0F90DRAFT_1774468 [Multifurca ochricompacta]|uniref:RNA polymerase II nuclear localization protein SLC7A6OS n=1 Tax=Multifurca ochricompacta TaxID=376703 RepID=A0AAD4LVI1_9AGAM|nr:hypothetical protein B0F90DRAFT_1774468 [Multifurca ochricompacta]